MRPPENSESAAANPLHAAVAGGADRGDIDEAVPAGSSGAKATTLVSDSTVKAAARGEVGGL
jgi:hypothetical protein